MKKTDFISKDIASVDKVIASLKYLNQGRELVIDEYCFAIAETEDGGFQFMMALGDESDDKHWVGMPDMAFFTKVCNRLSDDDITLMQANMVLQSINLKQRG